MADEYDLKAQYVRLSETDPDFDAIREEMVKTIEEEMPDKMEDFQTDFEIFLKGYEAVKKARFNRFDPNLVKRSKRGDIDESQQLLVKAGLSIRLTATNH